MRITAVMQRADALTAVAEKATAQRAAQLVLEAESVMRSTIAPEAVFAVLTGAMEGVASIGGAERARDLADCALTGPLSFQEDWEQARSLVELARAARGCPSVVDALLRQAVLVVERIRDAAYCEKMRAQVTRALIANGDLSGAEAMAESIGDPMHRTDVLADLAKAVAEIGDGDRVGHLADHAVHSAKSIIDPWTPGQSLPRLVAALGAVGHVNRAEAVADAIVEPYDRLRAWTELATVAANAGDESRAREIVDRAAAILPDIGSQQYGSALASVAQVFGILGDFHRAVSLARSGSGPTRTWIFADLAERSKPHLAEGFIRKIEAPRDRVLATARLAGMVATHGDCRRAAELAHEAETLVESINDPNSWAMVLMLLARNIEAVRQKFVAKVLSSDRWTVALPLLGRTSPDALHVVITELKALLTPSNSRKPVRIFPLPDRSL